MEGNSSGSLPSSQRKKEILQADCLRAQLDGMAGKKSQG